MIKLFGQSQIMTGDETFDIARESTVLGEGVNYQYGKMVKAPPTCFKVIGNIQPLNARDLLLVPEGDRFKEQYWLFCPSKIVLENGLEVQDIDAIILNDRVKRLGKNYQVQSVENWGSYTRARIMLIDVGPNATT